MRGGEGRGGQRRRGQRRGGEEVMMWQRDSVLALKPLKLVGQNPKPFKG